MACLVRQTRVDTEVCIVTPINAIVLYATLFPVVVQFRQSFLFEEHVLF